MDERYTLTVEREIPEPIAAVFDAWLDAATMAQWLSPAPDISVEATSDPIVGGQFRVVMKGRGQEIVHVTIVAARRQSLFRPWPRNHEVALHGKGCVSQLAKAWRSSQ